MPLGALLEETRQRGIHLLLIVMALPFVTPIPLPGLSMPFGIVIAIIGVRIALGQSPWLPRKLLKRKLSPRFLGSLLRAGRRVMRFFEWFLRPRLMFIHEHFVFRRVAGVLIAVSGLLMLAPLPLPFTNSLPAWTVLLVSAGAIERDGLFFIAGCVAFGLTVSLFLFLALGGSHVAEHLLAR